MLWFFVDFCLGFFFPPVCVFIHIDKIPPSLPFSRLNKQVLHGGVGSLPSPAGSPFANTAQGMVGLLCCKSMLLTLVSVAPRGFSMELALSLSTCVGISVCPGAGLGMCLCWTSWGLCQPTSPACPGPSEEQPCPPAWCSVQTCREYVASHLPGR